MTPLIQSLCGEITCFPAFDLERFLRETLRSAYISRARQARPTVPKEVSAYVVEAYVRLRKQHKDKEAQNKSHTYTSARTLLGVLRLSQALARLRFADVVVREDVDEALRLMEKSKESLDDDGVDGEREMDQTSATKIYRIIKDMASTQGGGRKRGARRPARRLGKGPGGENDMDLDSDDEDEEMAELSLVDIRQRAQAAGFTETQLMDTIIEASFRINALRVIFNSLIIHSTKILTFGLELPMDPNSGLFNSLLSWDTCIFYPCMKCLNYHMYVCTAIISHQ